MKEFVDTVIIGGGLAGLFYGIHNKNQDYYILEKSPFVGGKLKTMFNKNEKVEYECAAWRISKKHSRMIQLCKDLNLTLHAFPQTPFFYKYENMKSIYPISIHKPSLSSFDAILFQEKTYERAIEIENKTGYHDILELCSEFEAYDFKHLDDYFFIKEGFHAIIERLSDMQTKNIILHTMVVRINYHRTEKTYTLSLQQRIDNQFRALTIKCKKIILAIPPNNIKNIHGIYPILQPLLLSVESYPLHHIYGKFKDEIYFQGKQDFHICTGDELGQIISSPYHNSWIQLSYSGGKMARFWERLKFIQPTKWIQFLKKKVSNYIPVEHLEKMNSYFWEDAIHLWKPSFGLNKRIINRLSIVPHPIRLPNLFIVGEAFSMNQGWCEGVLQTVIDLYEKKNQTMEEMDSIPEEYVIYDHRVLDVKKWKKIHPGSLMAIENHMNEDITSLWNQIHSSERSFALLFSLQIGWYHEGQFYKI